MAKRKGMKFRTTQEKKTKQFRLFVLGFVGFLLAFALVFCSLYVQIASSLNERPVPGKGS